MRRSFGFFVFCLFFLCSSDWKLSSNTNPLGHKGVVSIFFRRITVFSSMQQLLCCRSELPSSWPQFHHCRLHLPSYQHQSSGCLLQLQHARVVVGWVWHGGRDLAQSGSGEQCLSLGTQPFQVQWCTSMLVQRLWLQLVYAGRGWNVGCGCWLHSIWAVDPVLQGGAGCGTEERFCGGAQARERAITQGPL